MSFTSFVWLKMCADIKIMKPREDVCATCSNFQSKISRALTEDDRISTTDALRSHVNKAIDAYLPTPKLIFPGWMDVFSLICICFP